MNITDRSNTTYTPQQQKERPGFKYVKVVINGKERPHLHLPWLERETKQLLDVEY